MKASRVIIVAVLFVSTFCLSLGLSKKAGSNALSVSLIQAAHANGEGCGPNPELCR